MTDPAPYVSPIAAETITTYRYDAGEAIPLEQRRHYWPGSGYCNPSGCRECYRERVWKAGQRRG